MSQVRKTANADDIVLQSRLDYYTFKSCGDNIKAYQAVVKLIATRLYGYDMPKDARQKLFAELKTQYQPVFDTLGFPFPDDLLTKETSN